MQEHPGSHGQKVPWHGAGATGASISETGAPGGKRRPPVLDCGEVCQGKPALPSPSARAGRREVPAPGTNIKEAYYCRRDLSHHLLQKNPLPSDCT